MGIAFAALMLGGLFVFLLCAQLKGCLRGVLWSGFGFLVVWVVLLFGSHVWRV